MIDNYKRYQPGLAAVQFFPERNDGLCACGCEQKLPARKRRWATAECNKKALVHTLVIKGDTKIIRRELHKRDGGVCRNCGLVCEDSEWDADHIVPVHKGGGGCTLDGYQTLCKECHKIKTKIDVTT